MILHHAFRQCGLKSLGGQPGGQPGKPHSVEVVVDRHPCMVAVRAVTEDERVDRGWKGAVVQAMLRVDAAACERLDLEKGRDLDRWIMAREAAVEALVKASDGYTPPFAGHRLSVQHASPESDWAVHLADAANGRFRDSKWLVVRPS